MPCYHLDNFNSNRLNPSKCEAFAKGKQPSLSNFKPQLHRVSIRKLEIGL